MSLTPDLVEWLLADKKVCQRWRNVAQRLNLGSYIPSVERLCEDERGKLSLVIRLWQATSPHSYTVRRCKSVLAAEGLHQMWLWISLMTQDTPHNTRSRTLSHTLPRQVTTPSHWSEYFQSLLPSNKANSHTSDYFSFPSTPDTSRTSSRLSDYNLPSHSRSNSQQSDYDSIAMHPSTYQTRSCPSTPLSPRRSNNIQPNTQTKPGRITPPSSDISASTKDRFNTNKSRVYDILYRPDLIKLSSPRIVRKAEISKMLTEKGHTRKNYTNPGKHKSASLGRLSCIGENCGRYSSSMEIDFDTKYCNIPKTNRKKSDHEKEILQLCEDIIAEMNKDDPVDVDTDNIYDKINTVTRNTKHVPDEVKSDSEKVNYFSINKVKTIKLSPINQEGADHQLDKVEKVTSCPSEYFDNLIKIIEKAVEDLST